MRSLGVAAALMLIVVGLASAQGVSLASEGKTAEQVYKNITALKGTPANELNQSMHLMKGALGVDCTYCHIEREWDKDVKAKPVARQMITMMMDINARQFGGRQVVTATRATTATRSLPINPSSPCLSRRCRCGRRCQRSI